MRIALLAHLRHPVAPPFAGGMEAHTWALAEGLTARGHEVVLFAAGDSDPRFAIDPVIPVHHERSFPGLEHRGDAGLKAHVDAGYAAACDRIADGGFDVLHNNSLSRLPLDGLRLAATPTVTSLHVPPYDALRWFVQDSLVPGHRVTVTSEAQRRSWWREAAPAGVSVLHNGVDPASWPYQDRGDGTAVWSGRIAPIKGTHCAVAAARRAGIPLTLFGPVEDQDYWDAQVAPHLGGPIRYGGHLSGAALASEVGRASVFLFTPCWDEPFGLVAIEAMACGVPVAGIAMGAAAEVVGEAGCLAPPDDVIALAAALGQALAIPRTVPHARVMRLFTRDLWLARCEALYAQVRAEHENLV
ncbi:Phosphatidyl-myo-inositol mannosyltransferase [Methylobacterium cerastii]|uniref:Phosphatidyl-myo-inositol mannosyltransferase n=1 Tax=Methylobacterium cerastii TaxID=932741 RepID=A0ABQ4QMU1_9HYPH|nr:MULTISPECIES: glycosyltransferase [Methylobacterium]TXM68580.1 glycosyltransferase family 4 protein [Methylobacterium sp. WL120]TXN81875.1 glycosyltransferase family 4 protein [Methylobacterium sp. WL8]GJD46054.1 Phosphatidyl-myo-inositol mannosyltransferase [Methylobacterium cerastii]